MDLVPDMKGFHRYGNASFLLTSHKSQNKSLIPNCSPALPRNIPPRRHIAEAMLPAPGVPPVGPHRIGHNPAMPMLGGRCSGFHFMAELEIFEQFACVLSSTNIAQRTGQLNCCSALARSRHTVVKRLFIERNGLGFAAQKIMHAGPLEEGVGGGVG